MYRITSNLEGIDTQKINQKIQHCKTEISRLTSVAYQDSGIKENYKDIYNTLLYIFEHLFIILGQRGVIQEFN